MLDVILNGNSDGELSCCRLVDIAMPNPFEWYFITVDSRSCSIRSNCYVEHDVIRIKG